jgi:hypothetical protein
VYLGVLSGGGDHLQGHRMIDGLSGIRVLAFAPIALFVGTVEMHVDVVCDCKFFTFAREPHRNIGVSGLMGGLRHEVAFGATFVVVPGKSA